MRTVLLFISLQEQRIKKNYQMISTWINLIKLSRIIRWKGENFSITMEQGPHTQCVAYFRNWNTFQWNCYGIYAAVIIGLNEYAAVNKFMQINFFVAAYVFGTIDGFLYGSTSWVQLWFNMEMCWDAVWLEIEKTCGIWLKMSKIITKFVVSYSLKICLFTNWKI